MFGNSPVKAAGKEAAVATQNLVHRAEQERRLYQELSQNLHRAAQMLNDAAHMLPQIRPQIRQEGGELPIAQLMEAMNGLILTVAQQKAADRRVALLTQAVTETLSQIELDPFVAGIGTTHAHVRR